jgi:hypothetical protein
MCLFETATENAYLHALRAATPAVVRKAIAVATKGLS